MRPLSQQIKETLFSGKDENEIANNVDTKIRLDEFFTRCLTIDGAKVKDAQQFNVKYGYEFQGDTLVLFTKKEPKYFYTIGLNGWDYNKYGFGIDFFSKTDSLEGFSFDGFMDKDFTNVLRGTMKKPSDPDDHLNIYIYDSKNIQSLDGLNNLPIFSFEAKNSTIKNVSIEGVEDEVYFLRCEIDSIQKIDAINAVRFESTKISNSIRDITSKEDDISFVEVTFPKSVSGMKLRAPKGQIDMNLVTLTNLKGAEVSCDRDFVLDSESFERFEGSKIKCGRFICTSMVIDDCKGLETSKSNLYHFDDCTIKSFEGLPEKVKDLSVRSCKIDGGIDWSKMPEATKEFTWEYNGRPSPEFKKIMKQKHPKAYVIIRD